jgi:Dolichyl-phosphate-mannose-protein mannosyltransferase
MRDSSTHFPAPVLPPKFLHAVRPVADASWVNPLVDFVVYAFILIIAVFQATHYLHTADFVNDATFPDLARSLVAQGAYQVSLHPQTTLPPGLPFLLAPVGRFFGFTPAALFPVIAVFTALALLTSYQLLRLLEGRGVAAASCLLLASSPQMFGLNAAVIFPESPYFFFSMLALLLALHMDRTPPERAPVGRATLLSVAIVLAVLVRSVGVALLVGVVAWCAASLFLAPDSAKRRMKRFWIPLALGLIAQLSWSIWAYRHQNLEWQLPGYPQSYLSQLKVKNGQDPELGLAGLSDIPIRVARNIVTRTAGLDHLLTRRYFSKFWSSPFICGVAALIALGLAASLRNAGQLLDWYCLLEEGIYLLWPWDYRDRFLFPVVPLACLYLWRGARELWNYSIRKPRTAGLWFAAVGLLLSVTSAGFGLRLIPFATEADHARMDRLQPIGAACFWAMLAAMGIAMFAFDSFRRPSGSRSASALLNRIGHPRMQFALRFVAIVALLVLVGLATAQQVAWGRSNLSPDTTKQALYPEIEASEWIRVHEPSDRVIMAREPEFVYHFTHRRVVWFPPISDPKVLMDGIRRHHVELLVVAHHGHSYWLPPEDACFQLLQRAYPTAFHLIHHGVDYWVFEVEHSVDGN